MTWVRVRERKEKIFFGATLRNPKRMQLVVPGRQRGWFRCGFPIPADGLDYLLTKEGLNSGQKSLPAQVLAVNLAQIGNVESVLGLGVLALGIKGGETGVQHLIDGQGVNLGQLSLARHVGLDTGLEDLDQGGLDQGGDDLELVLLERNVDHGLLNGKG